MGIEWLFVSPPLLTKIHNRFSHRLSSDYYLESTAKENWVPKTIPTLQGSNTFIKLGSNITRAFDDPLRYSSLQLILLPLITRIKLMWENSPNSRDKCYRTYVNKTFEYT